MRAVRPFRVLTVLLASIICYGGSRTLSARAGATPQNKTDTVLGTVLNRVTHEPIGRALVYSSDKRFAALTDSSGHFEFKLPASKSRPGNARAGIPGGNTITIVAGAIRPPAHLMARKPGFLPLENGSGTFVSPGQKEVTIYLLPEARIVGRVTVADAGLPGRFHVRIYRRDIQNGRAHWASAGFFDTWSNGEFRFAGLHPGSYKLFTLELMDQDPLTFDPRGQMYGYPPVFYPAANSFAAGSVIKLSAGVTFQADLTPVRREYYPVEIGLANAPQGAPLNVAVFPSGQGGPGYSLGYNPQGPEIQGLLPDGSYVVEVGSYGPTGQFGTVPISVNGGPATNYSVTLLPNIRIRVNVTEDFTLAQDIGPQPAASGAGQNQFRSPLQLSLVPDDEFGRRQGAWLRQLTGSEDEPLVVENVQPGRYWVQASSLRGYVASILCGETDLLRHPLVVSESGSHEPIEVTLRDDGASVKGIIENMPAGFRANEGSPMVFSSSFSFRGHPLPHIYLIPLPDSTGQFRETWARPGGKFSLDQIPPGNYRILASDRPHMQLEYRNEKVMRRQFSAGQEIHLLAGQSVQLRLQMMSGSE